MEETTKKYTINFDWNFTDSKRLTDLLIARNTYDEDYLFRVVYNRFAEFHVVLNKTKRLYRFNKSIWFGTEPSFSKHTDVDYILKNFKYIVYHDLDVFKNRKNYGNCFFEMPMWLPWYTERNKLEIISLNPVKEKKISFVVSGLNGLSDRGAIYDLRLNFLQKVLDSNVEIDIYGRGLELNDSRYKGSIIDKYDALLPYNFTIAIENSVEKNYLSEKFYDAVNCKTVPVYYGCPNVDKILGINSFVKLEDLDNITQILKICDGTIKYHSYLEQLENVKFMRLKHDLFSMLNDVLSTL
jgi:hypothetical protein